MRTALEKWRNDVLFGSRLGGWLLLHIANACPEMTVALIGIALGISGMETQFVELPVEVDKKRWVKLPKHSEVVPHFLVEFH